MNEAQVSPARLTAGEGDLRALRPPGAIRRFWARHPRLADWLIAVLYFIPAVGLSLLMSGDTTRQGDIAQGISGCIALTVGAVALVFRRRAPTTVLGISWAVTVVAAPLLGIADLAIIPLALYALAIYGSTRAAWIGYAGSVVVSTVASVMSGSGERAGIDLNPVALVVLNDVVPYAVILLIVVLIAITISNRRRYVAALIDRADHLERERENLAQLAAADERSRIAREMHDIVSHSLTVMVTLAEGSAATVEDDPARAAEGMRLVAETGRTALTDTRRMLGLLDSRPAGRAELAPQPGGAELAALVDSFRDAGLPVAFTLLGQPVIDPARELAVYRVVQESLTNALRHAKHPSVVEVVVNYQRESVTVTVTDDGAAQPPASPGGRGLTGMRQRVALYSGSLESGPRAGGGWRVAATLGADSPTERTP